MKRYTPWAKVSLHNIFFEFGRDFVEKSQRSFYFTRVQVTRKQENPLQMTPNWQIPYMYIIPNLIITFRVPTKRNYFPCTYPQIEITYFPRIGKRKLSVYLPMEKKDFREYLHKIKTIAWCKSKVYGVPIYEKPLLKIFCYSPFKHTVH